MVRLGNRHGWYGQSCLAHSPQASAVSCMLGHWLKLHNCCSLRQNGYVMWWVTATRCGALLPLAVNITFEWLASCNAVEAVALDASLGVFASPLRLLRSSPPSPPNATVVLTVWCLPLLDGLCKYIFGLGVLDVGGQLAIAWHSHSFK